MGSSSPPTPCTYPANPSTLGGIDQNYTFFEPLPFIVLAQLVVGQEFLDNTGGQTRFITNRLYIQPGVMMKFNTGSALDVLNPGASLNVGSRSYINGFDPNNAYSPNSPGFVDESACRPARSCSPRSSTTRATTTLVPNPINVTGETATESAAKLVPAMWGSVGIQSGAIAVINAATFQYGGGAINTPQLHHALAVGAGVHHGRDLLHDRARRLRPINVEALVARHACLHHQQQLLPQLRRGDADRAQRPPGRATRSRPLALIGRIPSSAATSCTATASTAWRS